MDIQAQNNGNQNISRSQSDDTPHNPRQTADDKSLFYLLLLDEFANDHPEKNGYLLGFSESMETFRDFTDSHDLYNKYDTAVMALVPHPDELREKILQSIGTKKQAGDAFDYYYLEDAEVRSIHRLTNEHRELYS